MSVRSVGSSLRCNATSAGLLWRACEGNGRRWRAASSGELALGDLAAVAALTGSVAVAVVTGGTGDAGTACEFELDRSREA